MRIHPCPLLVVALLGAAPSLALPRLAGTATIDGRLDEGVWAQAAQITTWVQQSPDEGEPATQRATLYLWRDDEALYFGIEVESRDPIAYYKRRDQQLYNDDKVELVIDPTGSGRNGYFFGMNPNGSRVDGTITGESYPRNDWDGFWEGAGRATPTGWTGEMRIPLRNLQADPSLDAWGFNARVYWAADREDARWVAWEYPNRLQTLSQAGTITGMAGAAAGASWLWQPFVLGRLEDPGGGMTSSFQPGLDTLGLPAPGWRVNAVANADFGEAEVDSLQGNLSRFSLFFPERRDFFLEEAGLFALGPRSASAFHSRRIGLAAGRPVPLRLGLKATGRAGAADLGILGAWVDGPEKEFFGVFRPRLDLTANLRAGAIAIRRESTGADHTTLGTDLSWRDARAGGDSTQIGLFAQTTEGATENGMAWGGEVGDRRGDWSWGGNWLRADAGYDPEVGFFPFGGYGGITQSSVRFRLDHDLGGTLLRRTHKVEGSELRQTSGKLLERAMELEPWSLSWRNGWNIQPSVRLSEARLESAFTPGSLPAITIPAGNHEWVDGEVGWFGHFSDYTWVFGGRAGGGDWYDASRVFASGWLQWNATESLTVGPNWNWNRVERAGVEDTSFVGRLDLTWTPDAFRLAKITVQRDDAGGVWAGNLRYEWRPRDGEAIFVVAGFSQSGGEDTWNLLLKRQWLVG